jgi:hypothetical protein
MERKLRVPPPKKDKTPFQRFEEFARKIVAVPKAEADRLAKRDQDAGSR